VGISFKRIKRFPRFVSSYVRFLASHQQRKNLEKKLLDIKGGQRKSFDTLSLEFQKIYASVSAGDDFSSLVTSLWFDFNRTLESAIPSVPSFSFLQLPVIRHTMFTKAGEMDGC